MLQKDLDLTPPCWVRQEAAMQKPEIDEVCRYKTRIRTQEPRADRLEYNIPSGRCSAAAAAAIMPLASIMPCLMQC